MLIRILMSILMFISLGYTGFVFCDSGIKQITHSAKIVYLAKSGLAETGDDWDIRWSTDYAIAGRTVIYVEQKYDDTESSFVGEIYSIVGPYISHKGTSDGYSKGAAHPWHISYFETINMQTGKKVKLTEIFDSKAIYKALLKDKVVRRALRGKAPKNLKELLKQADGGCEFSIHEDSLENFAFHHIKHDKVAVRLGLPNGCEVMRGNFTQIGFYLKIPKNMKKAFKIAHQKKLLMHNMAKLRYDLDPTLQYGD